MRQIGPPYWQRAAASMSISSQAIANRGSRFRICSSKNGKSMLRIRNSVKSGKAEREWKARIAKSLGNLTESHNHPMMPALNPYHRRGTK